jgi:hypothetical protein
MKKFFSLLIDRFLIVVAATSGFYGGLLTYLVTQKQYIAFIFFAVSGIVSVLWIGHVDSSTKYRKDR